MAIELNVDFTNVKGAANSHVPEGAYKLRIEEVTKTKAKSSGNDMLVMILAVADGPHAGRRITDRHILTEKSLWTLRAMMEAMGYKVKPAKMKIKDSMFIGKLVGAKLIDGEPYNNRVKSEVMEYIPVKAVDEYNESLGSEDEDDEDVTDLTDTEDDDEEGEEVELEDPDLDDIE